MRRILLPLAAAWLAACDGAIIPPETSADLYDFRLQTTPPEVLRWPSGTRVRVYAAEVGGVRAGLLSTSLAEGAAIWNRHALYGEYELVPVSSVADADAVLQWSDEPSAVDMSECPPVVSIAVTTFCRHEQNDDRLMVFPLQNSPDASTVRFVITILGTQAGSESTIRRLVTHELGHVLGIGRHSLNPQDLMAEGIPTRETLSQRDINTIQILYHTRPHITP